MVLLGTFSANGGRPTKKCGTSTIDDKFEAVMIHGRLGKLPVRLVYGPLPSRNDDCLGPVLRTVCVCLPFQEVETWEHWHVILVLLGRFGPWFVVPWFVEF